MAEERGCGGAGCILAREAGGQVVGICRCLPRELHPEDRMRLAREIAAQRDELRALRAIVAGRTTPPTDAEIEAHDARGALWLTNRGVVAVGFSDVLVIEFPDGRLVTVGSLGTGGTGIDWWIALDADGCPCAWPEVSRG